MIQRLTSSNAAIILAAFLLLFSFSTAASAAQVTLAWDSSSGSVAGYLVFVRPAGQNYDYASPAWQGTSSSCTIDQLDANTTYYFVARAFDSQGNESADSNEVVFRASATADLSTGASGDGGGGGGGGGCFIDSLLKP